MNSETLHNVMVLMSNIVDDKCNNREIRHTKRYRDDRLISTSSLKRYLKGRSPKTPLEEIMEILERDNIIKVLDKDPISGNNRKMIKLMAAFDSYKEDAFNMI